MGYIECKRFQPSRWLLLGRRHAFKVMLWPGEIHLRAQHRRGKLIVIWEGKKKLMRTSRDMSYYMINRISKQQTNGKIQCKSCQRTRKSAMFEGTIHILPVQKFASMLCSGKSCDFFCHLHLQLWGDHEIIRWFLQKASEMIPHHERSCGHLMVKPLSSLWMVVA